MTRVFQTRFGAPDGNCEAACYASIFELPIASVPDPIWPADLPWQEAQDATLTERGQAERTRRYDLRAAWLRARGLASLMTPLGEWCPPGLAVGSVLNPRGIPHAVVCAGGVVIWDPNPEQDSYRQPVTHLELFYALNPAELHQSSIFSCGCSRHKVNAGLCDIYGPGGVPR